MNVKKITAWKHSFDGMGRGIARLVMAAATAGVVSQMGACSTMGSQQSLGMESRVLEAVVDCVDTSVQPRKIYLNDQVAYSDGLTRSVGTRLARGSSFGGDLATALSAAGGPYRMVAQTGLTLTAATGRGDQKVTLYVVAPSNEVAYIGTGDKIRVGYNAGVGNGLFQLGGVVRPATPSRDGVESLYPMQPLHPQDSGWSQFAPMTSPLTAVITDPNTATPQCRTPRRKP